MSVLAQLSKVAKAKPLRSTLDEAVEALARKEGTGQAYINDLLKNPAVKPAELKERGLDKLLSSLPKANKEEIKKIVQKKPAPKLEQAIATENPYDDPRVIERANELIEHEAENMLENDYSRKRVHDFVNDAHDYYFDKYLDDASEELGAQVVHDDPMHQLPKGTNYREIKLKLPQSSFVAEPYHFNKEPGILAHMRVTDREGPNGEKILHLEELQSDWHQKGRDKGYKSNASEEEIRKAYNAQEHNAVPFDELRPEDRAYEIKMYRESGVPDAPFKKNWHEVALKKLINYATDNGYDKIAITPGAEQAKRWDMSKHIDEIVHQGNTLHAYKNGKLILNKQATEEDLPNLVGKEIASKLINAQPNEYGTKTLSGLDLEVGGEGHKRFYDKTIPDFLNKLGKPHGAEVQLFGMPVDKGGYKVNMDSHAELPYRVETTDSPDVLSRHPTAQDAWNEAERLGQTRLHTFDLTPSLKNEVIQKGLPLYQQIGIPLVGAEAINQAQPEPEMKRGGKVVVSNNPDTMFMELHDKKFAKGGAVLSLETNLPALPKTDYHSIDKLMAHISKEHKIAPQKLHDDFVAKHHMTPDTWIKRK